MSSANYGMTTLQYMAWSSQNSLEHFLPYARHGNAYDFISKDDEGRSALHFAARRGNLEILDHILQLSGDIGINSRDIRGYTALHYAVQNKRTDTLGLLVHQSADLHAVDPRERTVLHHAALQNNVAAVQRLIELGAEKDELAVDHNGRTPHAVAHHHHHRALEVLDYLHTSTVYNGSDGTLRR